MTALAGEQVMRSTDPEGSKVMVNLLVELPACQGVALLTVAPLAPIVDV